MLQLMSINIYVLRKCTFTSKTERRQIMKEYFKEIFREKVAQLHT